MIFSKLNGLGNDFVITDDRENKYTENLDEMARKLCHRRTGIGADGLVFVRNERNMRRAHANIQQRRQRGRNVRQRRKVLRKVCLR